MRDPNPSPQQRLAERSSPSHAGHSQDAPSPAVCLDPGLLATVCVRSHVARATVSLSTPASVSACVCVRTHACVPVPASARLPHGSRLEAEAHVSQIHFLAGHGWGKGQALFVSPHVTLSPSLGKPNLLKAQNVLWHRQQLCAVPPGPAGARAAVGSAAGAEGMVTHGAISGDLL